MRLDLGGNGFNEGRRVTNAAISGMAESVRLNIQYCGARLPQITSHSCKLSGVLKIKFARWSESAPFWRPVINAERPARVDTLRGQQHAGGYWLTRPFIIIWACLIPTCQTQLLVKGKLLSMASVWTDALLKLCALLDPFRLGIFQGNLLRKHDKE